MDHDRVLEGRPLEQLEALRLVRGESVHARAAGGHRRGLVGVFVLGHVIVVLIIVS